MLITTDSSTAPIALLLVYVVSTSGAPGWGKVKVTASESMRLVLVKTDSCSVFQVRFLGFPDEMVTVEPCDQLPWR